MISYQIFILNNSLIFIIPQHMYKKYLKLLYVKSLILYIIFLNKDFIFKLKLHVPLITTDLIDYKCHRSLPKHNSINVKNHEIHKVFTI